jgi:hypothetical protein
MIDLLIKLIGIALLSNFIAWQFTPLQELKNKLKLYNLPWYFGKLFYCHLCLGLWIGLVYTQSIWLGLITSYLSHILKWIYDKIEQTYD